MDEKEPVGPEQSTPVEAEIELLQGLIAAGLTDDQALRTTQAVRVQAGHNIKETLEVHRREVNTSVDGVKANLTAKIDGVDTKIDGVEANLTAKIERVDTKIDRVDTKIDGVKTELSAELESVRKELNFYRRGFIVVTTLLALILAVLTLIFAAGLLPKFEHWLWQDSTPAQSVQTPVESDPPETAVPPESDPPEPSPQ